MNSDFSHGTGRNVPHTSVICGFWRRLLALAIDCIILGLAGAISAIFLFRIYAQLGTWSSLLGFFIAFAYFGIFNSSLCKGQTLGKRIMNIEVVDRNGKHISLCRSFLRYSIWGIPFVMKGSFLPQDVLPAAREFIDLFALALGGSVIYLYIFNAGTRQSLHDLITGTYVIKCGSGKTLLDLRFWNMHFLPVALCFFFSIGILGTLFLLSDKTGKLIQVQQGILSTGKVTKATVSLEESYDAQRRKSFSYLKIKAQARPDVKNRVVINEIVAIVFKKCPEMILDNTLSITVYYGFDIGFLSFNWDTITYTQSPQERKKL